MNPLAGKTVLVTQPEGEELRRELERLGARVLHMPAIAVRLQPEALAAVDAGNCDWIVFTSGNAVRAFCQARAAVDSVRTASARVAAVGPSTARALEDAGLTVDLLPAQATGEALAEALIATGVRGKRVLLPQGNRAGPSLAGALRDAGATVDAVTVYRNIPAEPDESVLAILRRGDVDAVLLASPSALQNLCAMLGGKESLMGPALICIGPTTARAVEEMGLDARVASAPTVDALVGVTRRVLER